MDVFVIGIGFHAKRIYIRNLIKVFEKEGISQLHLIDIVENEGPTREYAKSLPDYVSLHFLPNQKDKTVLSDNSRKILWSLAKDFDPDLVIISTEPRFHKLYAEWAIEAAPSVLMDKPVTTRSGVSTDQNEALGIWEDYASLRDQLRNQRQRRSSLIINTQRRYDNGFQKCLSLIGEARDKFNVAVSSVQAMYSDGTWVMPNEFVQQESHPYKYGYGICSHSGYHILDFVAEVVRAGLGKKDACPDFIANTKATRPVDFVQQIPEAAYKNLFPAYIPTGLSQQDLKKRLNGFGEIDAHCNYTFEWQGHIGCQATVMLNHNSFSQRAWPVSNPDLYKGNGRVKQQQYIIHQGPFQSIHIHNYQSQDQHDIDNTMETEFGQNNHFDLYVLRNAKMFGTDKTIEKFDAEELYPDRMGRLSIEDAKFAVLQEAIAIAKGAKKPSQSLSTLQSHNLATQMLSASYISMSRHFNNTSGDVSSSIFKVTK